MERLGDLGADGLVCRPTTRGLRCASDLSTERLARADSTLTQRRGRAEKRETRRVGPACSGKSSAVSTVGTTGSATERAASKGALICLFETAICTESDEAGHPQATDEQSCFLFAP